MTSDNTGGRILNTCTNAGRSLISKRNMRSVLYDRLHALLPIVLMGIMLLFSSCEDPLPPVAEANDETYSPTVVRALLDEWQFKNFTYFYQGASPTAMALEGNDRGDGGVVTIGGTGFGVMSLIVGERRGWITREQMSARLLKIVRFLGTADRFHGIWSHWYNPNGTAHPFGDQVSTGDMVESSFLLAGLLAADVYLQANVAVEKEIKDSIESFMQTADFKFYSKADGLYWLWSQPQNKLSLKMQGWNECLVGYILALGAPDANKISYDQYKAGFLNNLSFWHPEGNFYGYPMKFYGQDYGGPLFFSHYSFLGLDPGRMEDVFVKYWQQNVSHTLINRHYCLYKAPFEFKYGEGDWGLTACYGARPGAGYSARNPQNDDGVIAPTAALSAYPYTPFYSTQVLMRLAADPLVQGKFGFADAYCNQTKTAETRHLAIDQGPMVVMMENYRSGLIWNLMMQNSYVQRGLAAAKMKSVPSYKEGLHKAVVNTETGVFDLMRHPDRECFELPFVCDNAGKVSFDFVNPDGYKVLDTTFTAEAGENIFTFRNTKYLINDRSYDLTYLSPSKKEYTLKIKLR